MTDLSQPRLPTRDRTEDSAGNDARRVVVSDGVSFAQSSYSAPTVATSTTADSEATPTGATKMELGNFSTTAAEFITYAFGTDTADAELNLATGGSVLFATGDKLAAPIAIPAEARDGGGFAFKSASGTPNMYRAYGG